MSSPSERDPRDRATLILLFVAIVLIAYASLYPFHLDPSRLGSAFDAAALRAFATAPSNASDTIANLLFYAPLGFALLLWFDRRRSFVMRFFGCLVIGAGVSFVMEWLQHLFPDRAPSLRDLQLNVVSTAFGAIAGYTYHRTESSRVLSPWLNATSIDPVVVALLACWVAVHSVPFLPKLGLYRAWEAIETVRNLEWTTGGSAWWFASYLVLAKLIESIIRRKRFWNAFIAVAFASLLAQIVFRQHELDFDECIGLAVALPFIAWFQRMPWWDSSRTLWGLVIAGLFVTALYPFDFTSPPRALSWLPLSGALDAERQNGMTSVISKTFLYGGLLWVGRRACNGLMVPTTLLVLATAAIEVLQTWLPTRTPESTDPLMMLLLALLIAMARPRTRAAE